MKQEGIGLSKCSFAQNYTKSLRRRRWALLRFFDAKASGFATKRMVPISLLVSAPPNPIKPGKSQTDTQTMKVSSYRTRFNHF